MGMAEVVTYIQSGNVIFEAHDAKDLKIAIEQKIETTFGFFVPVIIRTVGELQVIYDANPFGDFNVETEGTKVLVTFLSDAPQQDNIDSLLPFKVASEILHFIHQEAYFYCPDGYGITKLTNALLEKNSTCKPPPAIGKQCASY